MSLFNSSCKWPTTNSQGKLQYRLPVKKRLQPALPALFKTKVTHSDGSTITVHTTSPRPTIPLSRDVYNSTLWDFVDLASSNRAKEKDESGRMAKFDQKFGSGTPTSASSDSSTSSNGEMEDVKGQQEMMQDLLNVEGELKVLDAKMIQKADRGGKGKKKGGGKR